MYTSHTYVIRSFTYTSQVQFFVCGCKHPATYVHHLNSLFRSTYTTLHMHIYYIRVYTCAFVSVCLWAAQFVHTSLPSVRRLRREMRAVRMTALLLTDCNLAKAHHCRYRFCLLTHTHLRQCRKSAGIASCPPVFV